MARQPLIALAALALGACNRDQEWAGNFDVPEAVAVLPAGAGSPFEEPMGYVASLHGGRIAILSLRDRRYATDNPTASFLRAAPLATGAARVIGAVAVHAPGEGVVTVFAADRAWGRLLRVPHLTGLDADGAPLRHPVTVSEVAFVDADGSGDAAELVDLRALEGFATTEDWTLTYDGAVWRARGSRSGRLDLAAAFGEEIVDDRGGLAFRVEGSATAGDSLRFTTDNGLEELDVGGTPLALALSPDGSRLAAVVDTAEGPTRVRWIDPHTGLVTGEVDLPEDALPARLAWLDGAQELFVADAGRPALWQVSASGAGDLVTEHVLPWPISDVAPMLGERALSATVVPADNRSVWVFDLDAGALRDLNPLAPGVNGLRFDSTVRGVAPIAQDFLWPEVDDDQVERRGAAVAISLSRGAVVFLGEPTGCLITDSLGPRTVVQQSLSGAPDYQVDFDDATGGPTLAINGSNQRSVLVNRCGGVAREERWTLRFDAVQQGWTVEGTRSGRQSTLAYEDARYVSDDGAVSFLIRSGTTPSRDGWEIWFDTLPGLHEADGDNNGDGQRELSFALPGDPVWFNQVITPGSGGWVPVLDQPFLLVPAAGGDLVGKVDPLTGNVEAAYW